MYVYTYMYYNAYKFNSRQRKTYRHLTLFLLLVIILLYFIFPILTFQISKQVTFIDTLYRNQFRRDRRGEISEQMGMAFIYPQLSACN